MVDEVLRGIAGSDFADVLFRAAAVRAGGRHRPGRRCRTPPTRRYAGCCSSPSSSRPRPTSSWTAAWPERRGGAM